ncbi:hypothetical protein Mal4_01070 [Maioricimonas rarisocia]|uniref:Uncharacterized protein n=1 Tax=Maioricimonas rarisocia TaxID=2528026 RepID=A0A517Z045_9PLAN|nr:hypothetical protein [Maioricimonas rarisocia]QDU35825.1 hypothetical protein Mal4_01070 [Maioricimonas rarisocia]
MAGKQSENYYYAKGKRVPLARSADLVAIEDRAPEVCGLDDRECARLKSASRPLRGGVSLIERKDLGEQLEQQFGERQLLRPVFEAEGALLVPLPEIRIEESRPQQTEQLEVWLKEHAASAKVVKRRPGRMVLEPTSGDAEAALDLANQVHEQVDPEMAESRFIRVVPSPDTTRKR